MDAGTFLFLYDKDSGRVVIDPAEENHIDTAVTAYLESAGTRDSLLHLSMLDGDRYVIRASAVQSWMLSTPAGRRRNAELEKASDDEAKAVKADLGIFD